MQEGEMNTTIQDILVYLLYLIVVLTVANGNRNNLSFYMKDTLATNVVHGGLLCGRPNEEPCDPERDLETWKNPYTQSNYPNPYIDFMKVREVNQFWVWLHQTLIPNVRVQNWYNDDPPYGLRGYLDDRVNRIIGYAVVRQVREKHGNCRAPLQMRHNVESCTGDLTIPLLQEDDRAYCLGWKPIIAEDCVRMKEFEFLSEADRKSSPVDALYRKYSGGGYELRMKGSIGELMDKIEVLQNSSWIDNRTRAVVTEFNVYNAQVNQFGIVKIIAEFVGGGIMPSFRIDVITLTKIYDFGGFVTMSAEFLFAVSTFYYLMNSLLLLKSLGAREFLRDTWNLVDVLTIAMSLMTICLYCVKQYKVALFTQEIKKTRGNDFTSIDDAQNINQIYDYCSSLTVFTSMLKLCKLLSFQKAFRQIAATIRLCFIGLSTFVVEFIIVFGSFCCFFFFMLSSFLSNFRNMSHTVQNTLAMAIGKFNFASLKEASEFAAWIFFAFSIVVNMILINMMMAIINMAFEEIKNEKEGYQNKFEIITYLKRSIRELTGTQMAQRDLPVIKINSPDDEDGLGDNDSEDEEIDNSVTTQFSEKANSLLAYIDKTYMLGEEEPRGVRPAAKITIDKADPKGKHMDSQFDNIFGEGPTPTPSMLAPFEDEQVDLDDQSIGDLSMLNQSNVDGMNI